MTYREYEDKIAQLRRERDTAVKQLRDDYGVGLGEPKTPDVVKVVYCKDCLFSRELRTDIEKETYCEGVVMCNNGIWGTELAVWGDNFCSHGERTEKNV